MLIMLQAGPAWHQELFLTVGAEDRDSLPLKFSLFYVFHISCKAARQTPAASLSEGGLPRWPPGDLRGLGLSPSWLSKVCCRSSYSSGDHDESKSTTQVLSSPMAQAPAPVRMLLVQHLQSVTLWEVTRNFPLPEVQQQASVSLERVDQLGKATSLVQEAVRPLSQSSQTGRAMTDAL